MVSIKRHKVLFDASTASTGDWVACDVRYDQDCRRVLQIILTVGDTVTIEGITQDERGIDKTFLTELTTSDISTIGSFTADGELEITVPYTYIRAKKTGTTGAAKVQGFV